MPRFKPCSNEQKVFIPVSLEDQLVEGTLEHAIHHLIDARVREEWFNHLYHNEQTGRRAYPPKLLLKVILFGYSRGLKSSRDLESACRENVTFMALACQEHPDHSTFADFIAKLGDLIARIFCEVLLVCYEEGLLGATHFALDGLKLPSNASREWSGKLKDLRLKQKKIEEKIKEKLREHRESDRANAAAATGQKTQSVAVSEGSKRAASIERLKAKAERIAAFLEDAEPRQGARGEIQSNITDNESARMHTGHGTIQGYNAQALVDSMHQIIVHAEASSDGQDYRQLKPILKGAKEALKAAGLKRKVILKGSIFLADTSYHSEENLKACEAHGVNAFVPDTQFRLRDPRFASQEERYKQRERGGPKKNLFALEDFAYDKQSDSFICPAGRRLALEAGTAINPRGTAYRRYQAERSDCAACPLKARCLSGKRSTRRSLHVAKEEEPQRLTQQMRTKIDLPESRRIYSQRLAIVEPVFANLRYNKGLDRFTYRGRAKVNVQWLLYCLVHNLEKIAHFSRRFGKLKDGKKGAKTGSGALSSPCEALYNFISRLNCLVKLFFGYLAPQPLRAG